MSNPLIGGGMNPQGMLTQLMQNPIGMLQKVGFNVPQNLNNPQDIIQHLMNSGQISQQQLQQAQQQAQMFKF